MDRAKGSRMDTSTASVRDRIDSVRALIHMLGDDDLDEQGRELVEKVDEAFAALAHDLDAPDEEDETPLFV
jgi:hypothetical protein